MFLKGINTSLNLPFEHYNTRMLSTWCKFTSLKGIMTLKNTKIPCMNNTAQIKSFLKG